MRQIESSLSSNEYNIGWDKKDNKDNKVIEYAIKTSKFVKKATENGKTIDMARAIGDGIYYLIVDVVVSPKYQKKV